MRPLLLVPLIVLPLLLTSCSATVTTQVLTVTRPLPQQEQSHYRVVNDKGEQVGTALLAIAPDSDPANARLTLDYDFGPTQKDTGVVVVNRTTMKPVRAERTVIDGDKRYVTRAEYSGNKVAVVLEDGGKGRRTEATLGESAYDNLSSLFLWRTLDLSAGSEVRYGNIIIDPKRGGISRAVATIEDAGRGNVATATGDELGSRVQFRSAGITNGAWYRLEGGRVLLKYDITRGPTLLLESTMP